MSVPIRAVGFITMFIIGAIAGYRTHQEEVATQPVTKSTGDGLTKRVRQTGLAIVTADAMPDDDMSLSTYMTHLYRGLYMIGRTQAVLKGSAQESLARKLQHLHNQRRPRKDRDLIAWYQTVGAGSQHKLADLLSDCPETKQFDVRYIAHAMGETVPELQFPRLEREAAERFAA